MLLRGIIVRNPINIFIEYNNEHVNLMECLDYYELREYKQRKG